MENQTVRKFKWFWAWQDEKEEAWLSEMAQAGWHLKWPASPGIYIFEVGAPRNDVYRLDFITSNKDYQAYLQLFQDAGWQHLGAMGGWQYFRKTRQDDEPAEIYTDPESKVQKYRRLLGFLVVLFPIYIVLFTNSPSDATHPIYLVGKLLGGALMMLFVVAMIKIYLRMNQLKRL
jgi:hypothetical protein